ncbi:hypothetical protein AVDCRST_MAG92-1513 [uncultured Coleofasciculus sp.]|uniref:Uncharacterized protein n=1 Tax=uncultured Coleofasciculus sp. TaxID=1267456 RepID=A0A6J4I3U0_9CYAN|nr:hypothetical protein AVDCRST_MAG92-1513 [uncultured Coleofasciculus sp.]
MKSRKDCAIAFLESAKASSVAHFIKSQSERHLPSVQAQLPQTLVSLDNYSFQFNISRNSLLKRD